MVGIISSPWLKYGKLIHKKLKGGGAAAPPALSVFTTLHNIKHVGEIVRIQAYPNAYMTHMVECKWGGT